MYGGRFKQYFGWYVEQTTYRLGVAPVNYAYLDDVCPDEIVHMIQDAKDAAHKAEAERLRLLEMVAGPLRPEIRPDEITYWHNVKLEEAKPYQRLQRTASQLNRKVSNHFENSTREEFGFRKIGDAYISESLLYKILQRLFANDEIIRHYRPEWLGGLEVDIFLPARKLAFEYQGQQHFRPMKAWGGEEALVDLRERDARKQALCRDMGITLIVFDFSEPLTESHVSGRMRAEVPCMLLPS
jgi:hypothetical protein